MNLKGRLEKLEATQSDVWPCCILTKEHYFEHAALGVCRRTGGAICDFQKAIQDEGERRFKQNMPKRLSAEELEGLADLSQLKPAG